jgi:hypothetical protein
MAAALPFIAAGASALSTAVSVIQPLRQAESHNVVAKAQSKMAEEDAVQAEAETQGKETALRQTYRQEVGKRRTALASSSVSEEGSPLDLFYWDKQTHQNNILQTRYEGALQASRFRNQAALVQADAKNRMSLAKLQAGSNLLKGVQPWLKGGGEG